MATIRDMAKRARSLKKDINSIVSDAIYRERETYIEFLKDQHLKGQASDGSLIGRYQWLWYERYKRSRGYIDTVNLENKGGYHAGLKLRLVGKSKIDVHSSDRKNKLLIEWYGDERIHKLMPDIQQTFVDTFVMPQVRKQRDQYLFNG
jgi:hypothetical protein